MLNNDVAPCSSDEEDLHHPPIHPCNYLRVPSVIANGIFAKTLTKEEIAVFVILKGHDNIVVSKWKRLNG